MKIKTSILSILLATTIASLAGERHFTNVYETTTAAKGGIELENWVTWETRRGNGDNTNLWKFRHELEFGITDRFQVGLYLANWNLTSNTNQKTRTAYESASAEFIYRLSDPTTDPLGTALYLEIEGGKELFALEGKLLLQKNIGRWVIAWNGVMESEWEGHGLVERVFILEQTFGVSYQITPKFSAGAELVHEVEFDDTTKAGPNILFAGPNVSWRFGRGYITAATLFQCTNVVDEPEIQTRVIFGINF
jgi:hypothetical protein